MPAGAYAFSAKGVRSVSPDAFQRVLRAQAAFQNRLAGVPGGRVTVSLTNRVTAVGAEVPPDQPERLSQLPGVLHVYPVVNYKPMMDSAPAVHGAPAA